MDLTNAVRRLHLACVDAEEATVIATVLARLAAAVDDRLRDALVRHAYWHMPEVPTEAFGYQVADASHLEGVVGRGPLLGSCGQCGRGVRARHRDHVDIGQRLRCATCRPPGTPARSRIRPPYLPWEGEPSLGPVPGRSMRQVVDGQRSWAEDYGHGEAA